MDYASIADGVEAEGLRLVLTRDVPGPWSELAKAFFRWYEVDYLPVAQLGGQANPELLAWTGHRNAPIAIYKGEPPRVRWLEILHLAERLGNAASLFPADRAERIEAIGLTNEIAGEDGFAWHGRVLMMDGSRKLQGDDVLATPMFLEYGYDEATAAAAPAKCQEFLTYLTETVSAQKAKGSPYLVGDSVSVADFAWAYFSQLLQPLPPEQNPMPEYLRQFWGMAASAIGSFDPIIIAQRDYIFETHLQLPLSF